MELLPPLCFIARLRAFRHLFEQVTACLRRRAVSSIGSWHHAQRLKAASISDVTLSAVSRFQSRVLSHLGPAAPGQVQPEQMLKHRPGRRVSPVDVLTPD